MAHVLVFLCFFSFFYNLTYLTFLTSAKKSYAIRRKTYAVWRKGVCAPNTRTFSVQTSDTSEKPVQGTRSICSTTRGNLLENS